MVITKFKPVNVNPQQPISPQELAQKVANGGLKDAINNAIGASGQDYRKQLSKLLDSKKLAGKGMNRFKPTEADATDFLEEVYQSLPSFFQKMIDDAVEEQARLNKLTEKHKKELRLELANVISQEIEFKGKFA